MKNGRKFLKNPCWKQTDLFAVNESNSQSAACYLRERVSVLTVPHPWKHRNRVEN